MARECSPPPCTHHGNCTTCSAYDGWPAERIDHPSFGWDAGANSVKELDGDVQLLIPIPMQALGIVVGLKSHRQYVTTPNLIDYGWKFITTEFGQSYAFPVERGATVGNTLPRTVTDVFEITRVNHVVRYYKNGVLVRTSPRLSTGKVLVNACLYASGDTIG